MEGNGGWSGKESCELSVACMMKVTVVAERKKEVGVAVNDG